MELMHLLEVRNMIQVTLCFVVVFTLQIDYYVCFEGVIWGALDVL